MAVRRNPQYNVANTIPGVYKVAKFFNAVIWTTLKLTQFPNPTMRLFDISQYTIQDRNMHISVLNGAL